MATWMVLEQLYGRIYMSMLWRRVVVSLIIVFLLGLAIGFSAGKHLRVPSPPTGVRIERSK